MNRPTFITVMLMALLWVFMVLEQVYINHQPDKHKESAHGQVLKVIQVGPDHCQIVIGSKTIDQDSVFVDSLKTQQAPFCRLSVGANVIINDFRK